MYKKGSALLSLQLWRWNQRVQKPEKTDKSHKIFQSENFWVWIFFFCGFSLDFRAMPKKTQKKIFLCKEERRAKSTVWISSKR